MFFFSFFLKILGILKGLVPKYLLALGGAGFFDAMTTTKAFAGCVEARRDEYIQGIFLLPWKFKTSFRPSSSAASYHFFVVNFFYTFFLGFLLNLAP